VFFYATRAEEPAREQNIIVVRERETTPVREQASARVEVVVVPQPAPAPTTVLTVQPRDRAEEEMVEDQAVLPGHERLIFPFGVSLTFGGGVTGFLDSNTRSYADAGGLWEARLSLGTHSRLAVEAAYVGSLQNLEARGLGDDALLSGHGVEANVRLNAMPDALTQPYAFAGMGWTNYSVVNTATNTSVIADEDNVLYLPAGIGVGLHWNNMVLDMRATARMSLYDELIEPIIGIDGETTSSNLNSWAINARLGWEI
jgi:hypothetical protein